MSFLVCQTHRLHPQGVGRVGRIYSPRLSRSAVQTFLYRSPPPLGVGVWRCFGRCCHCFSELFLPIFFTIAFFAPYFLTSAEFLQVAKPKVNSREPLPDCIGAGGLSLLLFPPNPIIKRNARICCIFQSYKKTPVGKSKITNWGKIG